MSSCHVRAPSFASKNSSAYLQIADDRGAAKLGIHPTRPVQKLEMRRSGRLSLESSSFVRFAA